MAQLKHSSKSTIPKDVFPWFLKELLEVITHIKLLPVKDYHYCCKEIAKRYLHENLNN